MNEPRQVTAFQSAVIVINSTIGISILALPRIASDKVGAGALLVTAFGVSIFMFCIFILSHLCKRFPRESIITYSQKIIGKPLGKAIGFIIICFFAIVTSIVVREFGFVMNTTLMQETPITATMLSMLILVAVATRNNITTISYMHTYYFPFIIVPIMFMVIMAIQDADMRHLKPFWGNDASFMDFLEGAASVTGLPFIPIGLYIITVITPYMIEPKKVVKGALWGSIISSITILFATGITVAVFGSEEIDKSLWPMLVLTRMTELPASILERLDIVFLVVWIVSAFTTILSGYLICIELASKLFGLRSHRVLSYLTIPVIFGLSLYPESVPHLYEIIRLTGKWCLIITLGYPIVLLLISLLRGKRGSNDKKSNVSDN